MKGFSFPIVAVLVVLVMGYFVSLQLNSASLQDSSTAALFAKKTGWRSADAEGFATGASVDALVDAWYSSCGCNAQAPGQFNTTFDSILAEYFYNSGPQLSDSVVAVSFMRPWFSGLNITTCNDSDSGSVNTMVTSETALTRKASPVQALLGFGLFKSSNWSQINVSVAGAPYFNLTVVCQPPFPPEPSPTSTPKPLLPKAKPPSPLPSTYPVPTTTATPSPTAGPLPTSTAVPCEYAAAPLGGPVALSGATGLSVYDPATGNPAPGYVFDQNFASYSLMENERQGMYAGAFLPSRKAVTQFRLKMKRDGSSSSATGVGYYLAVGKGASIPDTGPDSVSAPGECLLGDLPSLLLAPDGTIRTYALPEPVMGDYVVIRKLYDADPVEADIYELETWAS